MKSRWKVSVGDCLEVLRGVSDCTVDALCTDPPAGIAFMGRVWDKDRGGRRQWVAYMTDRFSECYRVMKPGAHGLVWALPRTSHWTATALEDGGFEVRDVVTHLFGTGFPKSHAVSMSIDKCVGEIGHRGAAFSVAGDGDKLGFGQKMRGNPAGGLGQHLPVSEEAQRWEGWGTALKPASEHWILVRKPLEGTVAQNVIRYGTGALNIDATRIGTSKAVPRSPRTALQGSSYGDLSKADGSTGGWDPAIGRWPANLTLEHCAECEFVGPVKGKPYAINRFLDGAKPFGGGAGHEYESEKIEELRDLWACVPGCAVRMLDSQSGSQVSRFFYAPKASKRDKNEGLSLPNNHPTVKATALMEWLLKLITPGGGYVLDPFLGSGSTGVAAVNLGVHFLGCDEDAASVALARARIGYAWGKK